MPSYPGLLALIAISLAAPMACAQAGGPQPDTPAVTFDGVTFIHRWSQSGQHEFTPGGQEDMEAWTDMVTVNVHESVTDGDELAATANGVLTNYEGAGRIIRTDSRPRTDAAPAEHLVAAVLGSRTFLEAAFARVMLVDGAGIVLVYSHRVYGEAAGDSMSAWLEPTARGWRTR